ncbi:N-lysine methyltransferase KMT5A-A-like isoform X2 [Pimephales promelas]|uniref:N-lysine methyltransferase KMT5A-A-like isoform X2 n=1 Tax=Pimephales promelas TaxID=90988 RepID=UPI0019557DC4|nr:N-lysine methyltransferase KMT5A-A-like isoform X2 [Pimephales promelas]KAG1934664.1 N-lysine methyltransferase KMT5A [Pimephales promelas]
MTLIKEESEEFKIEEVFSLKQEDAGEQTNMALIKEESGEMKMEETFSVKQEDTVYMERKKRITPEQDAKEHILSGKDKAFIEVRQINTFKGRGVFALEHIEPSTFVVEYRGILSQCKHVKDAQGNYLFDFTWNGTRYCIDATKEDGSLGRLVNGHRNSNCKVETIIVDGRPHLCLFSIRDIFPDEEVTYNYGDSSCPRRLRELCDETSVAVTECSVNPSSSVRDKPDVEFPVLKNLALMKKILLMLI